MKTHLTNLKSFKIGLIFIFFLIVQTGYTNGTETLIIDIDVAPAILNLQNQAQVVTVHTSIAFSLVDGSTVLLNGIEINSWKADDRGFFVAKFLMEEVKDLEFVIGGMNELTLIGITKLGDTFTGSQEIKVIDVYQAKQK